MVVSTAITSNTTTALVAPGNYARRQRSLRRQQVDQLEASANAEAESHGMNTLVVMTSSFERGDLEDARPRAKAEVLFDNLTVTAL
jgi:hypothetical protein